MGANPTQAFGVLLFLVGFTLIGLALAQANFLIALGGALVLAGSCGILWRVKPWEHRES